MYIQWSREICPENRRYTRETIQPGIRNLNGRSHRECTPDPFPYMRSMHDAIIHVRYVSVSHLHKMANTTNKTNRPNRHRHEADQFDSQPSSITVPFLPSSHTMTSDTPSKPGGLSLYANLLDPSTESSPAPGTISRAPVVFKQSSEDNAQSDESAAKKQQLNAGRFPTLLSIASFAS